VTSLRCVYKLEILLCRSLKVRLLWVMIDCLVSLLTREMWLRTRRKIGDKSSFIYMPFVLYVAPICPGFEKGSDRFGSYVCSLSLYFCKRLFLGLETELYNFNGTAYYKTEFTPV
jgi:hypothetical protein